MANSSSQRVSTFLQLLVRLLAYPVGPDQRDQVLGERHLRSACRAQCVRGQYGGCLCCRCALAASTHHMRSSAKRGNAPSSALPLSPVGSPSADKVCPMGPTAIVVEITTIPISESVPCQAVAARAPDKRPAE